jgi:hypothetical protein
LTIFRILRMRVKGKEILKTFILHLIETLRPLGEFSVMAITSEMQAQAPMPVYIRLPRPGGRDPVCGLSRSQLRRVVQELSVRTVSVKLGDKKRGARLIDVSSLLEKLNALSESSGVVVA